MGKLGGLNSASAINVYDVLICTVQYLFTVASSTNPTENHNQYYAGYKYELQLHYCHTGVDACNLAFVWLGKGRGLESQLDPSVTA